MSQPILGEFSQAGPEAAPAVGVWIAALAPLLWFSSFGGHFSPMGCPRMPAVRFLSDGGVFRTAVGFDAPTPPVRRKVAERASVQYLPQAVDALVPTRAAIRRMRSGGLYGP